MKTPREVALLVRFTFVAFLLSACGKETVAVSYSGINQTDKSIVSIIVNGDGGVLDAPAHGGGGQVCCVLIPKKWRPGLKATINWQEGGTFQRGEDGGVLKANGIPVVIEGAWKERTVEVPRYEAIGELYIVFNPHDEIKVAVSIGYPDIVDMTH